jgi:7-cyano-7-deazaguanine synthase
LSVKVVALVSGGIDSAVLVWHLLRRPAQVVPVYIREGLAWEAAELAHLERYLAAIAAPGLDELCVLDLPVADLFGAHWSLSGADVPDAASADAAVYLPGRNLLLLAKAAVVAAEIGADSVALGLLRGNPFPDATPEFLGAMEQAISLGLAQPIRIEVPFAGMSKRDVVELGAGLPLDLTFTCLAPVGEAACGACNKCEERRRAFART